MCQSTLQSQPLPESTCCDPNPDDVLPQVTLLPDFLEGDDDWRHLSYGDPDTRVVSAILPVYVGDDCSELYVEDLTSPLVSESTLLFMSPPMGDVPPIAVYSSCVSGICSCVHSVGDTITQLKPCRASQFLFGDDGLTSMSDDDISYIWRGLVNGFSIVDTDCPATYHCQNYDSILEPMAYAEMSQLLIKEIEEQKVSIVDSAPMCVH